VDTARFTALFLADSRDHLHQCDVLLLAWERVPGDLGPVAGLFRAMHTIKGMAATLGYQRLTDLTHEAENLLDAVRAKRVEASPDLIASVFDAVDAIAAGVEDAVVGADGRRLDPAVLERLRSWAPPDGGALSAAPSPAPAAPSVVPAPGGTRVEVTIRAGVIMAWARALLALRRAEELGTVTGVAPDPATLDPDRFAGRLVFWLHTAREPDEVRRALLEVGEVALVVVTEADGASSPAPVRPIRQEVRVDRAELDLLLTEIGELVVARNRLQAMAERRHDPALEEAAGSVARLTDSVHARVLQVRMAPVGEVFDRFPRVVRDLARQLGKDVRLEIAGREIELDRSVLDLIGDPLLHLLRNALDHGLESPEARAAAGKPTQGCIRLAAARARDAVVLTVADDGRGVDRGQVRARLGAGATDRDLDGDDVLLDVLARPGFSTAAAVTGVSGRGVGIDAVMTRVREIGGDVRLESTPGQGTGFVIRLPVTLAVVPALLVTAGADRYAIPLARVAETGRGEPAGPSAAPTVTFRGATLPVIDLGTRTGGGALPTAGTRPFLVIEAGERRGALLVDTLLGRQDLVVGAFDAPVGAPAWLTGAAILADGVPALVVDPTGMFQEEHAWLMSGA